MAKKKRTWKDVDKADGSGSFVSESGVYNFRVTEAWDSMLAPEGTRDAKKGMSGHHYGVKAEVIDENSPQKGRIIIERIYVNSENAQKQAARVIEDALGVELTDEVAPDEDPASVGEFLDRAFKAVIVMKPGQNNPEKEFAQVSAPWEIYPPDEKYAHLNEDHRELVVDTENEATAEHYRKEIERIDKRKASAGDDEEMDDLPF